MTDNQNLQLPAKVARADTSFSAWLGAKMFTRRLDREVEAGVPVPVGTALAVHVARLTSMREREQIARALQMLVRDARAGSWGLSSRVRAHRASILPVVDLIDEATMRLVSQRPVRPGGMARLRLLLTDGTGPLYNADRGSLSAQLRGALAAL